MGIETLTKNWYKKTFVKHYTPRRVIQGQKVKVTRWSMPMSSESIWPLEQKLKLQTKLKFLLTLIIMYERSSKVIGSRSMPQMTIHGIIWRCWWRKCIYQEWKLHPWGSKVGMSRSHGQSQGHKIDAHDIKVKVVDWTSMPKQYAPDQLFWGQKATKHKLLCIMLMPSQHFWQDQDICNQEIFLKKNKLTERHMLTISNSCIQS